jgi:hypothetical protein
MPREKLNIDLVNAEHCGSPLVIYSPAAGFDEILA